MQSMLSAGPKIALRFPHLFACGFVHLHLLQPNKYVSYIVAMWHYFGRLDNCFEY